MKDIQSNFIRSAKGSFRLGSWFVAMMACFVILFSRIVGVMLAIDNMNWIGFGLLIFIGSCALPLLAFVGVPLIRSYVRYCQNKAISTGEAFKDTFDQSMASFAIFMVFPCAMLLLWLLAAFDALLTELPILGDFWAALFAFIGLAISFARVGLLIGGVFLLFVLVPEFALTSKRPLQIIDSFLRRIRDIQLTKVVYFFIALLPLIVLSAFSIVALIFSGAFTLYETSPVWFLSWISRSLFLSAFFSIPLLIFFHLSAEAFRVAKRQE